MEHSSREDFRCLPFLWYDVHFFCIFLVPNPPISYSPPRKVLNKLNFSVPDDVMRKIAQCSPGVVELVLIPLRQRLEERQRRQKLGVGSLQVGLLSLVIGTRRWGGVLGRGAPQTWRALLW